MSRRLGVAHPRKLGTLARYFYLYDINKNQ
jgi:hypothetical protein